MMIKCKMCGGNILFQPGDTYGTCDFCDSVCTIPRVEDEQQANRYNRANHFRRQCDFDKAMTAYEKILESNEGDAEAHFGIVLSRYGIEYVEDPSTGRRVPTCHRVQIKSILADGDYLAAIENAPDNYSRELYEQQAREIAEIQKGILAISGTEQPYDVFICYKETDANGSRTRDSQLAQDIYYALTDEGYRVFFAKISLEDKLGQQYEPYIFAALHSAKVMLAVGTKPEYFSAVWVKNEWSRYLAIMKNDRSRLLIPCYRDMDPYDLPEELSSLQSQDMGRIGFVQDLIRGIKKVLDKEKQPAFAPSVQQMVMQNAPAEGMGNISALLDRAFMALEDGEFDRADEFCEQALNLDARNARAYLGKLLAQLKLNQPEQLAMQEVRFDQNGNFQKALRFGDAELVGQLNGWLDVVVNRAARNEQLARVSHLLMRLKMAGKPEECDEIRQALSEMKGLPEAEEALARCDETKAELVEETYQKAKKWMEKGKWRMAQLVFQRLQDYKDSRELAETCQVYIDRIQQKTSALDEEKARIQAEMQQISTRMDVIGRQIKDYDPLQPIFVPASEEKKKLMMERDWLKHQLYNLGLFKIQEKRELNEQIDDLTARIAECEQQINRQTEEKKQYIQRQRKMLMDERAALEARQAELQKQMKKLESAAARALYEALKEDAGSLSRAEIYHHRIATGYDYTLGLQSDGTVIAVGNNQDGQCNVTDWKDVTFLSAGYRHTVGLKADGTVMAAGSNTDGECNVQGWTDIVALSAGTAHTVGLKADGTVVAVGDNYHGQCNVSDWTDIVALSAGNDHTVGLKADGTVMAAGSNTDGECTVQGWTDIVALSAGNDHTVGLKADGTVVAVGNNSNGQCDVQSYSSGQRTVQGWTDIVAISTGSDHTVGLKADGTVVAVGDNRNGQCDVKDWMYIVAIFTGDDYTVGLKADGTVVAVGDNRNGQCNVSGWNLLK